MCLPERRAPSPPNCSRCHLLRLASVLVWSRPSPGHSGSRSWCSEREKRQITCTVVKRAARQGQKGVRRCGPRAGVGCASVEAWTARTTESESSMDAMHPVLASSRRILALTYRRMFSGLLIRTTPVAIAVVCGAHERISCLAASLPDAERTRTRVSHCWPVPGAWWRARAHRRRRRSWEVRKHCKYQAAAGRALVVGPWCSLISRWFFRPASPSRPK